MEKSNQSSSLRAGLQPKQTPVAVIGLGQSGLPTAATLAQAGFRVTGYDIDESKVKSLNRGESYLEDVEQSDLSRLVDQGNFRAKNSFATLNGAKIIIIAVPTFITKQGTPDLKAVKAVTDDIVGFINEPKLIILESTVYPGATEEIIKQALDAAGLKLDEDYLLAYSPSRIDPGNSNWPITKIPKIVAGASKESLSAAEEFYSSFIDKVIPAGSIKAAETTKLFENSYRAVNIAFVDAMKIFCEAMDIDIWEIIDLASSKPFGFVPFYPGPGIGGECIPVVPLYLAWKAKEYGIRADFIEVASQIIDMMPTHFTNQLCGLLNKEGKTLKNSKILILGVAYKSGMSDTRKSPAKKIIRQLIETGAKVSYSDPYVPSFSSSGYQLKSSKLNAGLIKKQDAVVIVTEHPNIDYKMVADNSRLVLDTRNALPHSKKHNVHH